MNDSTTRDAGRSISENAYIEERFRLMVEGVQDSAIYLLDPSGMVQSWNIGAQRLKQYSADEVMGKHFSLFYPPEDRLTKPAEHLQIAAREGSFQEEAWRMRKDGSRLWASVIVNSLKDREGELIGYSKVTRDLTDRRAAEEAYRESEQRFRLMIEGVQDSAIFLLDEHGTVKTWNAGAERIQGYSGDEVIGQHFSMFYTPQDQNEHKPALELEHALSAGKFEEEGWRVRKDGHRLWANIIITPLKDGTGKVAGYSKVTRDLTERRAAEESVRRSQARFEGIVRISEDAIISIDDEQKITMFNDGAEKIFGYAAAEVIGQQIDVLVPDRFGAVHHRYVANFGASPDALRAMNERGAIYGRRKDGGEFPAEASISKFEVGGEKVLTVRLRDITERMNAEEAVRLSQARFEGIVRISEDAIISIGDDQNITMFNDGAAKIFGYTVAEVLGKRIDMLIPARFGTLHQGYVNNFSGSPDTLRPMNDRGSLFGLRKDGSEFPAEASISKFEIGNEKVLTVRLRDITDRKRAEEQIRASLHEKVILLKEIHHRVKNNLQVVSSLLSLQAGYPRVEAVRDLFIESQNRVKSMALIHEKLYQSQDLANIDFSDYIESLARSLFHSYTANPDQVRLETDVDVSLDIDHAIPCGLIVNELLSNSLKHAFPDDRKGIIHLYFHATSKEYILRFRDDGIGMPADLDFRNTESLGLQLVNTLTGQLSGTVDLRNGAGAEFEIRFPAPPTARV